MVRKGRKTFEYYKIGLTPSFFKLRDMAEFLHLKRTGSISTTVAKLKSRLEQDRALARKVVKIKREYDT